MDLNSFGLSSNLDEQSRLSNQFQNNLLQEQAASSSRSAEVAELLGISQRSRPKCALCAAHGLSVASLGHKRTCPYQECTCKHCWIIRERRRFVAKQMRNRRDQMKNELQQVRQRRSDWHMMNRSISRTNSDLGDEQESQDADQSTEEDAQVEDDKPQTHNHKMNHQKLSIDEVASSLPLSADQPSTNREVHLPSSGRLGLVGSNHVTPSCDPMSSLLTSMQPIIVQYFYSPLLLNSAAHTSSTMTPHTNNSSTYPNITNDVSSNIDWATNTPFTNKTHSRK